MYIKNKISFKICDVVEGDMEFNYISVVLSDIRFKIGVFYKPPRYNFENFMDIFQEILTIEKKTNNNNTINY